MSKLSILLFSCLFFYSCTTNENKNNAATSDSVKVETKTETEYTCPMHPEVIRKEAGSCPECGMDLQIRS